MIWSVFVFTRIYCRERSSQSSVRDGDLLVCWKRHRAAATSDCVANGGVWGTRIFSAIKCDGSLGCAGTVKAKTCCGRFRYKVMLPLLLLLLEAWAINWFVLTVWLTGKRNGNKLLKQGLWGGNKVNLSFFGGENKQLVGRGEMIHTVNIGF